MCRYPLEDEMDGNSSAYGFPFLRSPTYMPVDDSFPHLNPTGLCTFFVEMADRELDPNMKRELVEHQPMFPLKAVNKLLVQTQRRSHWGDEQLRRTPQNKLHLICRRLFEGGLRNQKLKNNH